ncbi:DUF2510 domain-containing protein, partial [Streptomyces sp. SID11385]
MSAPTPAAGDAYPGEGYYPDPSIPGYLRYWSGTGWVAGTSRPAPADGSVPPPPPGYPRQAAQPPPAPAGNAPEETGPLFFDGPRTATSPVLYGPEPTNAPQEPDPWSADTSQGRPPRVSWGAGPEQGNDPRVPHPAASPESTGDPNPYRDTPQPPYDTRPPLEPVRPQPTQPRPEGTGTVSLRPQGQVTPYQGQGQGAGVAGAGGDGAVPGGGTGPGERRALDAPGAYPALPSAGGPTTGGQGTLSMRPRSGGGAAGEWERGQQWGGGPGANPENGTAEPGGFEAGGSEPGAFEPGGSASGASARGGVAFGKPAGMDDTVRARAARLAEQEAPPAAYRPAASGYADAAGNRAGGHRGNQVSGTPGNQVSATPGNPAPASHVGPTGGPSQPLGEAFDRPLGGTPGTPAAPATPGNPAPASRVGPTGGPNEPLGEAFDRPLRDAPASPPPSAPAPTRSWAAQVSALAQPAHTAAAPGSEGSAPVTP